MERAAKRRTARRVKMDPRYEAVIERRWLFIAPSHSFTSMFPPCVARPPSSSSSSPPSPHPPPSRRRRKGKGTSHKTS